MTTPKQYSSDILKALNFPKAGDTLGETKVVSSKHNFLKGSIMRYQIVLPKGTREKDVPTLLKSFFNTQMLEGEHNMMVKHHDYTVKPHEGKVAVVGAMHIVPIALANPGAQEFDEDYSKMEMSNPETYFRKFDCKGFSGTQFRAKLFSLVSFMGENYGYSDGSHIYHRRASLVMPKIKITKAIKDANMMYHTHPKKDEPSLSSADDYLLYFDLSHEPRSIRDFYTVMKDRMDHFKITPKKGSKDNYLKLSEDKFIDEVNAKMDELEGKWTQKIPKEGATPQDDLAFCEGITRDLVAWLNKKYGKMFTIKYKCYYKVKQNPPKLETQDIHLNDEFLKKALVEVSSGDYTWPGFKADTQPHESYAYWHQRYYTEHVRDSYMTLGVNLFGTDNRRRDEYLNMPLGESTLSRLDALNILNLSYDVAKADGKIRDGTGFMSRLDDLCEYLELSQDSCDNLKLLEDVIHSGDVFSESSKTLSGDYYPLVLLSFYSIQAIEIMKKVNAQEMNLEVAKFEVYNQLKAQVGGELTSFLREHIRLFENGFVAGGFHTASNPPVQLRKVEAYTQYPPEAFDLSDLLRDAFDEPGNSFNPERVDIKKKLFGATGQIILYVPTTDGRVTMMIYRSTGKAQIKGPSLEACAEAAKKVNQQLYKYGARGVKFDDKFDISEKAYAVNPSKAQVITISGPSGSGKSSMIRALLKMLPNSKTAPTITTRQQRKSDKPGERTFVTVDAFKKMANQGALVGVQLQASGNYYARKKSDFENADYVLVDVSLRGVNDITSAFPNTFSIFLEPVETPEIIRQRLLRRGDMSAKEAAGRAAIIPSMIESSKKMSFDARIQTQQGRFDYAAKQAFDLIPKQNPGEDSGKLTDLHMLAKYTVEELENDNDLPTVAECAAAVTKKNFIGGGAFGKVFRVPGTDYLFKVNRQQDEKVFAELTKYFDGKSKTFTYPTEGVTRYRVDYRIPFECGQPRAWLRREGGGSEPDTIMNNLEGFTIADKIPQGKYEKGDKRRFKAQQGLVAYYPADKIKEYYKWIEEVSKIPQESINQTVSEMQYLISRGVPQDIHSGNMIYNPKTKKVTITDWFWDEKAVGRSIITNSPSLTGIFERVCIVNWIRTMTDYFSQHGKKPAQKEASKVFKAGADKATRQALEYFEKCLKAFEANKVSPSKSDYQESFFSSYKFETETYVDMIRRVLSDSFPDYYYDFDEVQRADAVAISNPTVPKKQLTLDAGETIEERAERDEQLAAEKERIRLLEEAEAAEAAEREARHVETPMAHLDQTLEERKAVEQERLDRNRVEAQQRAEEEGANRASTARLDSFENPKDLFSWFKDWVELVNMKNKELKAFLDSDWGKVAGLSKQEAKDWNNIKSGRVSGRRILKMRKKLGLTGPKDYIKLGPRIIKDYYEKALDNWTGPSNDMQKGETDWDWCKRQVRFNKRFMGDHFGKRKGPLVKKQKTQNQPSRRLLSLWVWGHDPWRYARKVEKRAKMPKCPDVPWIGMTEKRKYGKIPVMMAPRKNPPPKPHDGDAIITYQEMPWGTQIIAECPFDGIKGGIEPSMEDACNHIYPRCGHVLRINPDKPCCCEKSEHPATRPDHWPNTRDNPMAPGYQSYGWTTQDWRSIKVNNKGDIDYSQKCGAEGTKTPSGSPRLCLPAAVVKSLIRTDSGKEVIRKQARKKARAKKGERVPWHPRIKKIWKRIEDKTVKDKPNPPSFISARDPEKWSDRYDKIIKMSGDELMQLAEKQAAERGLTIELTVENIEYKENSRRLKLPPKQQKMYKEYIESMERATITLSRGNQLIDELRFGILTQSPKELVDYLTNRKVWRKDSNGKSLPQIGRVRTQYEGNQRQRRFRVYETPMVATLQNKKRFPFAVGGGGGYEMSEGQKGKGYYGIIKTYQAGFLEANNMEQYGMGETPMRSDLYQSYGWLTAFSYKDNYPYSSKAAEYYLNVAGKTKLANKDADYLNVYRPVYSRKMTGAAYRAGVKKMLGAVTNPPEWRHGEFSEDDPFEEYF